MQTVRQVTLISLNLAGRPSDLPAGISDYLLPCNTAAVHSFRYIVRQDCCLSYVPSINQDILIASCHAFQHSCIPAIRKAGLSTILNVFHPLILKYRQTVFLPTFKDKELIIFIQLYGFGSLWHSKAEFVWALNCNTLTNRALLCRMIFINRFMQKYLDKIDKSRTALNRFSLLHLIRPEGRIFVFTRTRQVVF